MARVAITLLRVDNQALFQEGHGFDNGSADLGGGDIGGHRFLIRRPPRLGTRPRATNFGRLGHDTGDSDATEQEPRQTGPFEVSGPGGIAMGPRFIVHSETSPFSSFTPWVSS